MRLIITVDVEGEEAKVISIEKIETEKKESSFEEMLERSENGISMYATWFNEGCVGWTTDAEYNKMFVMQMQNYANDILRARGHLFLNDVYKMFGMPETKYGQVVGWVYDPTNPNGDNYVDFGLFDERNAAFMNGHNNTVLLDFNVDGNILDRI